LKKLPTSKSVEINEDKNSLETKLKHFRNLLNQSIDANDEFKKTRSILHEMREIIERLEQIQGPPEEY
jgi:uncharacterized protein YPO0396